MHTRETLISGSVCVRARVFVYSCHSCSYSEYLYICIWHLQLTAIYLLFSVWPVIGSCEGRNTHTCAGATHTHEHGFLDPCVYALAPASLLR